MIPLDILFIYIDMFPSFVLRIDSTKIIQYTIDGKADELVVDEILVCTGRAPNVEVTRIPYVLI